MAQKSLQYRMKAEIYRRYLERPVNLSKRQDVSHAWVWSIGERESAVQACERFCSYLKKQGFKTHISEGKAYKQLPNYILCLHENGLQNATIHGYISKIFNGFSYENLEVKKSLKKLEEQHPEIIKYLTTRGAEKAKSLDIPDVYNLQGFYKKYNRRPYDAELLARCTGIRREKLPEIRICDCRETVNPDGTYYYNVLDWKDKGGKNNHTLVVDARDKAELERLLAAAETRARVNHRNVLGEPLVQDYKPYAGTYQAQRRYKMQSLYKYFVDKMRANPAYEEELRQKTIDLYKQDRQLSKKQDFNKDFKRLCSMKNTSGISKTYSVIDHRRHYYNFIAVMAVSIYSNDHFRAQVTRENYLDYQFVRANKKTAG